MKKDLIVNAALPYATYLILSHFLHWNDVNALAAGAVFPLASILVTFAKEGRLQAIGLIVLVATIASIVGSFLLDSPTLLLAKGSLITGMVGLVFAVSLLWKRPLVYFIATGGDAEARREGEQLWAGVPRYRQVMRTITIAWAVALFVEATVRLILIPLLPIEVFLPISETMWIVFFAPMTAWSWRYGRREIGKLEAASATG